MPNNSRHDKPTTTELQDGDSVILTTIHAGANPRNTTTHLYVAGASGPEPLPPEHAALLQAAGIPVVAAYAKDGRTYVMNKAAVSKPVLALLEQRGALK